MPIQSKLENYQKYVDVNVDGYITLNDAAIVLQKVINPDFIMLVEIKNYNF